MFLMKSGCGKTVSAVMAIAKTIWDKENNIKSDENNDTHFRILVITPKSVCPQFKAELLDKLNFDNIKLNTVDVEDISNESSTKVKSKINEIAAELNGTAEAKNHIILANPHKMCLLTGIKWDLIIIDEAHDIVCNSKKQTEEFHQT